MVGLQGSGKSTWVSRHLSGTHAVVSKDHWPRARRREARQRRIVAELLASGARVVVDNTNPAPEDRAALIAAAREAGVPVRAVWMDTPAEVCLARNDARQDRARVPLQVRVRDAGPLRAAHDRRGLRPGGRRHDGGDLAETGPGSEAWRQAPHLRLGQDCTAQAAGVSASATATPLVWNPTSSSRCAAGLHWPSSSTAANSPIDGSWPTTANVRTSSEVSRMGANSASTVLS
jgi:hypothetical protein